MEYNTKSEVLAGEVNNDTKSEVLAGEVNNDTISEVLAGEVNNDTTSEVLAAEVNNDTTSQMLAGEVNNDTISEVLAGEVNNDTISEMLAGGVNNDTTSEVLASGIKKDINDSINLMQKHQQQQHNNNKKKRKTTSTWVFSRKKRRTSKNKQRSMTRNITRTENYEINMNVNKCMACSKWGKLLCCETCPAAFHLSCIGLKEEPSDMIWSCPICQGEITHDMFRLKRQKFREEAKAVANAKLRHRYNMIDYTSNSSSNSEIEDNSSSFINNMICGFCKGIPTYRIFEFQDSVLEDMNEFLGPFWYEERSEWVWTHKTCALWAPRCFFRHNALYNLIEELSRARRLICAYCRRSGAAVGCCVQECHRSYHITCARRVYCYIDNNNYSILCPRHFFEHLLAFTYPSYTIISENDFKDSKQVEQHRLTQHSHFYSNILEAYDAIYEAKTNELIRRSITLNNNPQNNIKERKTTHQNRHRSSLVSLSIGNSNKNNSDITSSSSFHIESSIPDLNIKWNSIGGLHKQINILKEYAILPLIYHELYNDLHINTCRGVLLYGPSGTGKTLLVKALVSETQQFNINLTFFNRKGSDMLSKFYGQTESRLRMLFEEARKKSPSIIFFDEFDGLVPIRSSKQNQVHSSVVTTLLSLMDGLDNRGQIFIIAATNRIDNIDPALRRPGRFDKELFIPLPNINDRYDILSIATRHWKQSSLLSKTFLYSLAESTNGFSGADLNALCTEAALAGVHRICPSIFINNQHSRSLSILDKLLYDLIITKNDFKSVLSISNNTKKAKVMSSNSRYSNSIGIPLPQCLSPFLTPTISQIYNICKNAFSPSSSLNHDDESSSGGFNFGILIHGSNDLCGQDLCISALLNKLDTMIPYQIDIPSLSSYDQAENMEEALVINFRSFNSMKNSNNNNAGITSFSKPSILYLPHIDTWWKSASSYLRSILLSYLREFPFGSLQSYTKLIIATSDMNWTIENAYENEIPIELYNYFSKTSFLLKEPISFSNQLKSRFFLQYVNRLVIMRDKDDDDTNYNSNEQQYSNIIEMCINKSINWYKFETFLLWEQYFEKRKQQEEKLKKTKLSLTSENLYTFFLSIFQMFQ